MYLETYFIDYFLNLSSSMVIFIFKLKIKALCSAIISVCSVPRENIDV